MATSRVGGELCEEGIDVAYPQARMDWSAPVDRWVVVKATEGLSHRDAWMTYHVDGARRRGMLTGRYHFHRVADPRTAALHFYNTAGGFEGDALPWTIDDEDGDAVRRLGSRVVLDNVLDLAEELFRLCDRAGLRWPVGPFHYLGAYHYNVPGDRAPIPPGYRADELARLTPWVAAYTTWPREMHSAHGLSGPRPSPLYGYWAVWQYAGGNGRTPGVSVPPGCDRDVMLSTTFARLLAGGGPDPEGDFMADQADRVIEADAAEHAKTRLGMVALSTRTENVTPVVVDPEVARGNPGAQFLVYPPAPGQTKPVRYWIEDLDELAALQEARHANLGAPAVVGGRRDETDTIEARRARAEAFYRLPLVNADAAKTHGVV